MRFAIDDFGVGYSSLSYLSQLPIHKLKIDRSFIAALQDGVDNEVLVATIQRMAEGLRLETVAEGIETEAQFVFCRDFGVTAAQGLLFSAPSPSRNSPSCCGNSASATGCRRRPWPRSPTAEILLL